MRKLASIIIAAALTLTAFPLAFSVSGASAGQKVTPSELQEVLAARTKIPATTGSATLDNEFWWANENDANLVFDGDISKTKIGGYTDGVKNVSITWSTGSATPAYLVLYAGHDSGNYGGEHRNPVSFELYGYKSDSDTTGTKLVTGGDEMMNADCAPTGWKISTNDKFVRYKLTCVTSEKAFQLEEIELYSATSNGKTASGSGLTKGRYNVSDKILESGINVGSDCGMIDGNVWFDYPISFLTGSADQTEAIRNVKLYVNGTPATFNIDNYTGAKDNCGFSYDKQDNHFSGLWIGAVGAKIVKGENKVTILFGDKLYAETTFTSGNITARAVDSSTGIYFPDLKKAEVTVTFADAVSYKKGDEISARLHDDHDTPRTFTVESVSGKTVKFVSKGDFTTSHTILEFGAGTDENKFSVLLNYAPATDKAVGFLQTRPIEGDAGHYDLRILAEGYRDYLNRYNKADFTATLTLADGSTKDYTYTWTGDSYATVKANGETVTASDLCGYLGMIITKVPSGTRSVSAKVVFSTTDGSATDTVELGSANLLLTTEKTDLSAVTGKTGYSADKITVYADETFTNPPAADETNHEDESSLFDGTLQKMCKRYGPVYFETEDEITISGLVFAVGNDTFGDAGSNTRTFLSWNLSGWDGSKWVRVASSDQPVTDGESNYDAGGSIESMMSEHPGNFDAFTVTGAGSYSRYRLEFTRNENQQYTQMAELMLYTD